MSMICETLIGQSRHPDTDFEIADWSVKDPFMGDWNARVREKIRCVDQVIAICGEHTHYATGYISSMCSPFFLFFRSLMREGLSTLGLRRQPSTLKRLLNERCGG
jgi:hypothetical protein